MGVGSAEGIMEVRVGGAAGGENSAKGERAKSEAPEAAGHDRQI